MISKVKIIANESNNLIAEYSFDLVDDVDKEDYFDEAWESAIDDGLVDESIRLKYDIKFVDEENLEDITNTTIQHPLPNP